MHYLIGSDLPIIDHKLREDDIFTWPTGISGDDEESPQPRCEGYGFSRGHRTGPIIMHTSSKHTTYFLSFVHQKEKVSLRRVTCTHCQCRSCFNSERGPDCLFRAPFTREVVRNRCKLNVLIYDM